MLRKYVHHCATLIQKTYKGYIIKKKYRIALAKMYRFQEIVGAMVCENIGWKTRRILKCKKIKRIILEIEEMERFKDELSHDDSKSLRDSIPITIKKKKAQLKETFYSMYQNATWLPRYTNRDPHSSGKQERSPDRLKTFDYGTPLSNNSFVTSSFIKDSHLENTLKLESNQKSALSTKNTLPKGHHRVLSFENPDDFAHISQHPSNDPRLKHMEVKSKLSNLLNRTLEEPDSNPYPTYPTEERSIVWEERETRAFRPKANPLEIEVTVTPAFHETRNPWEERENRPVKGASKYVFPDFPDKVYELPQEEAPHLPEPGRSTPKKDFLRRSTNKYDPKKSIEKEKERGRKENYSPNRPKSIKNTSMDKFISGKDSRTPSPNNIVQSMPNTSSRKTNFHFESNVNQSLPTQSDDSNVRSGDGDLEGVKRKFEFLKRKSHNMNAQKVDWKNTPSRVDCWGENISMRRGDSPLGRDSVPRQRTPVQSPPNQNKRSQQTTPGRRQQTPPPQQNRSITPNRKSNVGPRHPTPKKTEDPVPFRIQPNYQPDIRIQPQPHPQPKTSMFQEPKSSRNQQNLQQLYHNSQGSLGYSHSHSQSVSQSSYHQFTSRTSNPPFDSMHSRRTQSISSVPYQSRKIDVSDLEGAYNESFLSKYKQVIQKFHGDGLRGPGKSNFSQVPVVKLNSKLVRIFHGVDYEKEVEELQKEYMALHLMK